MVKHCHSHYPWLGMVTKNHLVIVIWGMVYYCYTHRKLGENAVFSESWCIPIWSRKCRTFGLDWKVGGEKDRNPFPWRIRMYGRLMPTWLGYIDGQWHTIYSIHGSYGLKPRFPDDFNCHMDESPMENSQNSSTSSTTGPFSFQQIFAAVTQRDVVVISLKRSSFMVRKKYI